MILSQGVLMTCIKIDKLLVFWECYEMKPIIFIGQNLDISHKKCDLKMIFVLYDK